MTGIALMSKLSLDIDSGVVEFVLLKNGIQEPKKRNWQLPTSIKYDTICALGADECWND